MKEWIVTAMVIWSTATMLLASLGIVRMPDVYSRLQVTTKGTTLGAGLVLLAVGVYFASVPMFTRALLGMAFLALTQPIAAHMLGRAAYLGGAELWERTEIDELGGPERLTASDPVAFGTSSDLLAALEADDEPVSP